ncbi:MAG: hypothetical protein ACOC33_03120 [bacterium]
MGNISIDILTGKIFRFNNLISGGTGSGGTSEVKFIEVDTFDDLPPANTVSGGTIYLVLDSSSGVSVDDSSFSLNGLYRSNNVNWEPINDVRYLFNDDVFRIYGNDSKRIAFGLENLTSGSTKVLSVRDFSGTLAYISDFDDLQTGNTRFNNLLITSTTINNDLFATGNTNLNDLNVTGNTNLNDLNVTGNTNLLKNNDFNTYSSTTANRISQIASIDSAGIIYPEPEILVNNGTISVSGATIALRDNPNHSGELRIYDVEGKTFDPTPEISQYIVADYSGGTPAYDIVSDVNIINESNIIPIVTVTKDDLGKIHFIDWNSLASGLPNKIHERLVKTDRFKRESGLNLSEGSNRTFTISSGFVWNGAVRTQLNAYDSTTDPTHFYFNSGGSWEQTTAVTQYNNTQYDNGTDLVTLSGNRYAVNWIYRLKEENPDVAFVLGNENYKLSDAIASQPPSNLPPTIMLQGVLVGRIIIRNNETTAERIESAFESIFTPSLITSHDNLEGLENDDHPQYALLSGRAGDELNIDKISSFTGNSITINDNLSVTQSAITNNLFVSGNTNLLKSADFIAYTANTPGDVFTTSNKVIYVSKNGNDANSGEVRNEPKLTIQAAINAATSGDSVQIIDGGIYEESITTKLNVNIVGERASLDLSSGRSMIINESYVRLRSIFRDSGSNIMITASGTTPGFSRGYAILDLNEIDDSGSGVTIQNGLNIPLDLHIKQVYVRNSNIFLQDFSDSTSHTHVNFDDLYLNSSGCTGIEMANSGNVLGNIQHVKELGAGIGVSRAFNLIDGEVNLIVPDCRATVIADIQSAGVFRFSSQRFSGDINNSGGTFSYFTTGTDDGSMKLSTNLDISLDSDSITLPRQSGNTGAFLSVGTGGLINYTTLTEPGLEWIDDTEGVTTVNTTTEVIVYSVIVDQDVTAGSYNYQLNYTPGFFMNTTARLRRTNTSGTILNSTNFNGSGTQTLSFSLPITSGNTITAGDVFVLTVQFGSASPGNTVNSGFLQVLKTGNALIQFENIIGSPRDNVSLDAILTDIESQIDFVSAQTVTREANIITTGESFTIDSNNHPSASIIEITGATDATISFNTGLPNGYNLLFNNLMAANTVTFSGGSASYQLANNVLNTQYSTAELYVRNNVVRGSV